MRSHTLKKHSRGRLAELEIALNVTYISLQFLVLPNFHSCFYNCMENVFYFSKTGKPRNRIGIENYILYTPNSPPPFLVVSSQSFSFAEHGYLTGHSEDGIEYGPFHYRLTGYKNQPTDLYSRPFFLRVKKFVKSRPNLCLNSKNIAKYQFDYIRSMFKSLPNKLKFFLSFSGKKDLIFVQVKPVNNAISVIDILSYM